MELGPRAGSETSELPAATARRRGERTRTIPEQIADHLGIAIVNGEYKAGERFREQEIAELYGVSRGPVREAIRALERRGLVEFYPRRGAYVVDVSLDAIADIFNIRAALLGLAARCFARQPPPEGVQEIAERAEMVRALASDPDTDPAAFALATGRTGRSLYRYCGNAHLVWMLHSQSQGSLWGLIWRERPPDFLSAARRAETAADWMAIATAVRDGNELAAERITRKALFDSRDNALAALGQLRGESAHPTKVFRD